MIIQKLLPIDRRAGSQIHQEIRTGSFPAKQEFFPKIPGICPDRVTLEKDCGMLDG
jgi:hypothetical protein